MQVINNLYLLNTHMKTILITGGAGFIGSHVVRLFVNKYPDYHILNLDKLTYAGNLENLQDIENAPNYTFKKADIVDKSALEAIFSDYSVQAVIHLAAESHVDRSISDPFAFVHTNIIGTMNLLETALRSWQQQAGGIQANNLFYHISTDEVFGALGDTGFFTETTPYSPRSPYSASKASSDHLVQAYHHTYGLPMIISNCSNNYGSHQFPEKLIPLCIHNIQKGLPLPIYGNGKYTRDWLWVEDHARAIDTIFHNGKNGETYNIGGHNEWKNIDLVGLLCDMMDEELGKPQGESRKLITFVKDRAGHDLRYAIDATKLAEELNWKPSIQFEEGLKLTLRWYLSNQTWLERVTSGAYQQYYTNQYAER